MGRLDKSSARGCDLSSILLGISLLGMTAAVVVPNYIRARMENDSSRPPAAYRQCVDHNLPAIAEATQRWGQRETKRYGRQANI